MPFSDFLFRASFHHPFLRARWAPYTHETYFLTHAPVIGAFRDHFMYLFGPLYLKLFKKEFSFLGPSILYREHQDKPYILRERLLRALNTPFTLTRFGRKLKPFIEGSVFYDLGCGLPESSVYPRALAQLFGAKEYVGVDVNHVGGREPRENVFSRLTDTSFRSSWVESDILEFLQNTGHANRANGQKRVFFMAGIEPEYRDGEHYLKNVAKMLTQITRPGDVIIWIGKDVYYQKLLAEFKTDFSRVARAWYRDISVFERR